MRPCPALYFLVHHPSAPNNDGGDLRPFLAEGHVTQSFICTARCTLGGAPQSPIYGPRRRGGMQRRSFFSLRGKYINSASRTYFRDPISSSHPVSNFFLNCAPAAQSHFKLRIQSLLAIPIAHQVKHIVKLIAVQFKLIAIKSNPSRIQRSLSPSPSQQCSSCLLSPSPCPSSVIASLHSGGVLSRSDRLSYFTLSQLHLLSKLPPLQSLK